MNILVGIRRRLFEMQGGSICRGIDLDRFIGQRFKTGAFKKYFKVLA